MGEPNITTEQPLSVATEDLMRSIETNNRKARNFGIIAILLLVLIITIGVVGIYKQNTIAVNNQRHIDCIIKLSETPLPANERAKFIDNLNNTCQIRFTK